MEEALYDDKLAGEISAERYRGKLQEFEEQRRGYEHELGMLEQDMGKRFEDRLVLIKLTQKAAEIYARRSPAQKRLIISKLFSKLTIKGGVLSVEYRSFAKLIANNVQETRQLMEAKK